MTHSDERAAIAEFIRSKGATRCPTACLVPTQGSVTASDKLALWQHQQHREELRQEKLRSLAASLSLPGIVTCIAQ
jgi:hypothetical protein